MDMGKKIQKLRVSKDIKQADIAMALEIDVSSYSRLEGKGNKITVEQLVIIASALGVSLNELLGLDAPVVNQDRVKKLEEISYVYEKVFGYVNHTLTNLLNSIADEFDIGKIEVIKLPKYEVVGVFSNKDGRAFIEDAIINGKNSYSWNYLLNDFEKEMCYKILTDKNEHKSLLRFFFHSGLISDSKANMIIHENIISRSLNSTN